MKTREDKSPRINFDCVISAALDYMSAYGDMRRHFPHGCYLYGATRNDSQELRDYHCLDRAERALSVLCEGIGITTDIAVQAARIENHYYERGGSQLVDSERLITTLL